MKYLLLILLFPVFGYSQEYLLLKGQLFPSEESSAAGFISVGKYDKAGIGFGLGMGVITTDGNDPYIPLFAEASYLGRADKKIAPFVNFAVGYSVYDGSSKIIGETVGGVKGGFYGHFTAGAGYKISKTGSRANLYGGMSVLGVKKKLLGESENYFGSMFTAGVAVSLVTR